MKKNLLLMVMLVLIGGSIWYLQSQKVGSGVSAGGQNHQTVTVLSLENNTSTPTVTSSVIEGVLPQNTKEAGSSISSAAHTALTAIARADQKAGSQAAIEIADPTGFVNTAPFKLSDYIGKKVILVDFWTYSCINCIRTLPYLTAWDAKYKDQGLLIVGIHTPEFNFEKDINNVTAATKKYGIHYPVVLDSNRGTWDAYNNLYWPHEYLIDIAGYIVHDHVGEGDYDATEAEIQKLLAQRSTALGMNESVAGGMVKVKEADLSGIESPETYFGANRNNLLANGSFFANGSQALTIPNSTLQANHLYLGGTWDFEDEYAKNISAGAEIDYRYQSQKVYLVAAAPTGAMFEVYQDGAPVSASAAGNDVINGKVTVKESRLYNLINNSDGSGTHVLKLIIESPGLQAFTFTFG